jgi:hypothetical protein
MLGLDEAVVNQIILNGLVSAVLTGIIVFVIQKVLIETWVTKKLERFKADLQITILNETRKLEFIERQIEEFYSPMLGCLRKIQAKSLLRFEIEKVSEGTWKEICEKHPSPFLDHEKYFEPFMKTIRYNNDQLRKEIIPLYDEMVVIFTDKYWLATPSTRKWFSELSAFVDLWHRWFEETIPNEVIQQIGHNEDQLKPFYKELECQIDTLYKTLSYPKT